MGTDIIEIISGNKLSHQRVVGETQSVGCHLTHHRLAEACLITCPACCFAIGHTSIHLKIKALFCCIVPDGR